MLTQPISAKSNPSPAINLYKFWILDFGFWIAAA
jgi:hypothetical protein